ncbi:MAG TPA: LCP family protein [Anaerolineales bacterium]|nr:LCP family protein [Anaerolineales bacterium]
MAPNLSGFLHGFLRRLRAFRRPTVAQFLLMGVGIAAGIILLLFSDSLIACWRLTSLPGVPPAGCTRPVTGTLPGTPSAAVPSPAVTATPGTPKDVLPPPWDGASRVTILLIGLDYRDWETGQGAPRSDTLMLLTVDPVTKKAAMLSVPRDLWVNIPGFGYSKINSAYADGEASHLQGGGSALAMRTVEAFLGVPIQYYVKVDFQTFVNMIDTIGGIDVNVPAEIVVDPLGPGNTVTLEPGLQHLNGALALGYARNRHTQNGDIDRAGRQQQVILAIRQKVLEPGNFLKLMSEAPSLYAQFSAGIDTNLSLTDVMQLAVLAKDIPLDSIQSKVIDFTMEQERVVKMNGQDVDLLQPYPDKIRALVDEIFGSGAMQPLAKGSQVELMQADAATVIVVNASDVNGMAARTADYLKSQGMNVIASGNRADYPDLYRFPPLPTRTEIIVHAGKLYTLEYLGGLMKLDSGNQLVIDFDPKAAADIILAVGSDWAHDNPMP